MFNLMQSATPPLDVAKSYKFDFLNERHYTKLRVYASYSICMIFKSDFFCLEKCLTVFFAKLGLRLVEFSSEAADHDQLNSTSEHVGELMLVTKLAKCKSPSPESVFALSTLSYCGNMPLQHGGLRRRGSAPSVDIKGSF